MSEISRLAEAMRKSIQSEDLQEDYGWHNPALDVIDCVLSINRKYKAFVLPRVYGFQRKHPEMRSLHDLRKLIAGYPTPLAFSLAELNYNDAGRAETLRGVVNYLLRAQASYPGSTELERLENWARAVKPKEAYSVGVKGFGLAGFQYLRMLFGAQTSKPDVHITNFVSDATGRRVGQEEALELFEQAAKLAGLPVRQADNAIWEGRERKS